MRILLDTSIFNQCISGLISVISFMIGLPISNVVDKNNEKPAAT